MMHSESEVSQIKQSLHPFLQRVECLIEESLHSDVGLLDSVNRFLRERPGKMMRPMLAILCAGACGSVGEDTLSFAAAAELLHNATLLHDDVVDDAPERRGRPTVSSILGGRASVLIGDYWLVRCMQLAIKADHFGNRVINIFAKTLADLAQGEMLQMEKASSADTTLDDYLRIIYCKTASLFETAALSGSISAGASEEVCKALAGYAAALGIAFQIKDDIFDYGTGGSSLGKPVGQDILEQKITLPLLCAMDEVPESEQAKIRSLVAGIADNPSDAGKIVEFVSSHGGVEKAVEFLDRQIEKAVSYLDVLPESNEKSYLVTFARYVGSRNN